MALDKNIKLTIGIPTRNRPDALLNIIDSIKNQSFNDFHIIISDDGNIKDIDKLVHKQFPDLDFCYIQGPKKNAPANRQNIINASNTELVLLCDDDHILKEDCIEILYHTINAYHDVALVSAIWPTEDAPIIDFEEVKYQEDYRLDLDNINESSDYWWKNGWLAFAVFHNPARLLETQFVGGGCVVYQKAAVISVGGFPTDYSPVSFRDDTDISYRLFLKGWRLLINPNAIAYHHMHPTGGCCDINDVDKNREKDGLLFLRKLEKWRCDASIQKKALYSEEKFHMSLKAEEVKNIIWVRTDAIGDNILASSMLPYLREKYKHCKLTVVCDKNVSVFYKAYPFVDNVVSFDGDSIRENKQYRDNIVKQLQSLNPDIAINTVYSREPLTDILTIESYAKEKIAFNGDTMNIPQDIRDKHNELYTKLIPSDTFFTTELERYGNLLKTIGIDAPPLQPQIFITPDDKEFADNLFSSLDLNTTKTIAMFPGVQVWTRTYDKYGIALAEICKENNFVTIALGTMADRLSVDQNLYALKLQNFKVVNLCGKTTLGQSAAILNRCCLAVGAETGIAHLACAVGTPNVILLGGGHFGRFMPYSKLTTIVCLPLECYGCNWQCKYPIAHCVNDIKPEVIAEAIRHTLTNNVDKIRLFTQGLSLTKRIDKLPEWKPCTQYIKKDGFEVFLMDNLKFNKNNNRLSVICPFCGEMLLISHTGCWHCPSCKKAFHSISNIIDAEE